MRTTITTMLIVRPIHSSRSANDGSATIERNCKPIKRNTRPLSKKINRSHTAYATSRPSGS